MVRMDSFEGRCRLDWWANSITLLASVEISVSIAATDTGWNARGRLISENDDEREGFAFLRDLDPIFLLRFDDESTIAVIVNPAEDGQFTLTEYVGPERRSISHQINL